MNDHGNHGTGDTQVTHLTASEIKWRTKFLKELSESGNVKHACKIAKISRQQAYRTRENDPDFAKDWDDAKASAVEGLEYEAYRRGVEGVLEPVFYLGAKVGTIRKYSDGMLSLLLKANKPEKYRENHRHEHVIPPINIRPDLSKLSIEELKLLRALREKLDGEEGDGDST